MIAIDTGPGSDLYLVLLLLHILTAIVGLGGVTLNGIYGVQSQRRPGPEGRAISEANYLVNSVAEKFIYAVPVFGLLLVWASDGAWSLGDTWVWLSIVVYAAALGVSHALLIPRHRRMNALMLELESAPPHAVGPPPQAAQLAAIGKQMGPISGVLHLALVVLLVLMIWKPGA